MCRMFDDAPIIQEAIVYKDVADNYWAKSNIEQATRRGFFAGYPDGTFRPQQPIPRVQALIVLAAHLQHRIPENPEEILTQYFDDAAAIPNYARERIAAGAIENLVVNYPEVRQLKPNQNATRGEIAAFLCQALRPRNVVSWEYIAYSNLFAITPQFDYAAKFSEGLANVIINGQNCFIDTEENIVITLASDIISVGTFSERMASVNMDDKSGYIDREGRLAIPAKFSLNPVYYFAEGLALAKLYDQTKWGYINKSGDWHIIAKFDGGGSFSQGRAKVRIGSEWGYIDREGNSIIEPKFSEAGEFAEGLAPVKLNHQWGYINRDGDWVIQPEFGRA
ncbi:MULTISPECIES: WG repeat-containing protein [Limnospira]|uniref:WG repeat-containing protein n=2 Tax=Oscillatoriophycideae TaxID=1301283 RepID=UPI00256FFECE|nr:WG repeat-containing protein [Limnospira sp. Paracas R14]